MLHISMCTVLLLAYPFLTWSVQYKDFNELSIEELMNIDVTLVSRKPNQLFQSAAAVFVITQKDIRRSGATSIPEMLRMVPGIHVARIDGNKWAITSRGFNSRLANKLLVLLDGRTLYSPLFAGVIWNSKDTFIEDIERIEVIRGPGASLWGSNAVNGIINIITKTAYDTQDTVFASGLGTEEKGFVGIRYGRQTPNQLAYRVYAKHFERDGNIDLSGHTTQDDWIFNQAGFRSDWEWFRDLKVTVQGDMYSGKAGHIINAPLYAPPYSQTVDDTIKLNGGNVLAHIRKSFSHTSEIALRVFYDRAITKEIVYKDVLDTIDFDFQHRFAIGGAHELIWGGGYRINNEYNPETNYSSFNSPRDEKNLISAFIQDDITLVPDTLKFILGAKLEVNDYTGNELQPSARMIWSPHDDHAAWTAISRSVRTPSRMEEDVKYLLNVSQHDNSVVPSFFYGSDSATSEELISYELGYRIQLSPQILLDFSTFFNQYEHLLGVTVRRTVSDDMIIVVMDQSNVAEGDTYGFETSGTLHLKPGWQLHLSYTALKMDMSIPDDMENLFSSSIDNSSPQHIVSIRSTLDVTENFEFDIWTRYVDGFKVGRFRVPKYTTLDLRLGWRPFQNVAVSIVGQNLLDEYHVEFIQWLVDAPAIRIQKSVYGKVTFSF